MEVSVHHSAAADTAEVDTVAVSTAVHSVRLVCEIITAASHHWLHLRRLYRRRYV